MISFPQLSTVSEVFEFLGKMITNQNPIFLRNTSIKWGSQSESFFKESAKKGLWLWLSLLIQNLSPAPAKNDLDHAKNEPKLPNLGKGSFKKKKLRNFSTLVPLPPKGWESQKFIFFLSWPKKYFLQKKNMFS